LAQAILAQAYLAQVPQAAGDLSPRSNFKFYWLFS